MNYDIIGDIHGHVEPLQQLLHKLGYELKNGYYQHPEGRKVIFVGDFIDRGPHIRETLQLVKAMTDNGTAEAIMGNHEYNAICFHFKHPDTGEYLRTHSEKNIEQHEKTIAEFASHETEWKEWIEWFLKLPLFIEKEKLRVVHACWDEKQIAQIKTFAPGNILPLKVIYDAQERGTEKYETIERTLKGKEIILPDGLFFLDKYGQKRRETRTKWWLNAEGAEYNNYFIEKKPELEGKKIKEGEIPDNNYYSKNEVPVFFGHYWMDGEPVLQTDNVVCLDYSIAKEGKLVAYQHDGEKSLRKEKLKWTE